MKNKKYTILALSLVVLLSVAACAPQDTGFNNQNRLQTRVNQNRLNENTNWNNDGNGRMIDNLGNNTTNGTNNNNLNNGMVRNNRMTTSLGNLNTQANEVSRKIAALPEVQDCSVVLHNNKALVGVDLNNNKNTTNNNTNLSTSLRNKIEKIVKDNTNIQDVSITADPSMNTRIRNISTGMTNQVGNDVRDFTNDIEQLIRDIVPGGRRTNTNMMNR